MISPPQMAAGLLALIVAGGVTYFGSSHKPPPPLPPGLSPVASAFTALEKSDRLDTPRIVKAIPVPHTATSEVAEIFLSGQPPPKHRIAQAEQTEPEPSPAHRDVCAKYGGHRVEYTRHHHELWRCVYPHGRHHHRWRD